MLENNKNDRKDIRENAKQLEKKLDKIHDETTVLIEGNFEKNWNYSQDVERTVQSSLRNQNKSIDNMRFELVEILDNR